MHAVLHRVFVAHVVDPDLIIDLADALDPAFSLFKSGRIPGKVKVDQGPKSLEVQPLACSISTEQQPDLAFLDETLNLLPAYPPEHTILINAGVVAAGIDPDDLASDLVFQFFCKPVDRVIILREDDTTPVNPPLVEEEFFNPLVLDLRPRVPEYHDVMPDASFSSSVISDRIALLDSTSLHQLASSRIGLVTAGAEHLLGEPAGRDFLPLRRSGSRARSFVRPERTGKFFR